MSRLKLVIVMVVIFGSIGVIWSVVAKVFSWFEIGNEISLGTIWSIIGLHIIVTSLAAVTVLKAIIDL